MNNQLSVQLVPRSSEHPLINKHKNFTNSNLNRGNKRTEKISCCGIKIIDLFKLNKHKIKIADEKDTKCRKILEEQLTKLTEVSEQIKTISDSAVKKLVQNLLRQLQPMEELIAELSITDPDLSNYLQEQKTDLTKTAKKEIAELRERATSLEEIQNKCNRMQVELRYKNKQILDACDNFVQVAQACARCDEAIKTGTQDPSKESPEMIVAREGLKKLDTQCEKITSQIEKLTQEIADEKDTKCRKILEEQLTNLTEVSEQIESISNYANSKMIGKKQNLEEYITTFFDDHALFQIIGSHSRRIMRGKLPCKLSPKNPQHYENLKREYESFINEFNSFTPTTASTTNSADLPLYFRDFTKGGRWYNKFQPLLGRPPSNNHHLTYEECEQLLPLIRDNDTNITPLEKRKQRFSHYQALLYMGKQLFEIEPTFFNQLDPIENKLIFSCHNRWGSNIFANNAGAQLTSVDIADQCRENNLPKAFRYLKLYGCNTGDKEDPFVSNAGGHPSIKECAAECTANDLHKKGFYNITCAGYLFEGMRYSQISPIYSNIRRISRKGISPEEFERGSKLRIFFFYLRIMGRTIKVKA